MTREQMANVVEYVADDHIHLRCLNSHGPKLMEAATELRKTCSTCRHFRDNGECYFHRWDRHMFTMPVPADGSGFCHRWEAKP